MSHLLTARTQTSIATAVVVLLAPLMMMGVPSVSAQTPACVPNKNINLRVVFTRVANVNAGNALPQVELGNGLTVAGGANIKLVEDGGNYRDLGDPIRNGLNLKRSAGTLSFRNHGHATDFVTRKTLQGNIIIEGGHFTGFTNGAPLVNGAPTRDPLEEQGDGTYDETAGNDEVRFTPNATVIPFFTTVSDGSDNWTLTYAPDMVCTVVTPTPTSTVVTPISRVSHIIRQMREMMIMNTNMNKNTNMSVNNNTNTQTNNIKLNNSSNNSANNSSNNSSSNNNWVYVK